MHTQQKSVDAIANNLANVNTPGFKKGRVSFEDLVYRQIGGITKGDEGRSTSGLWQGNGVGILSVMQDFTQGTLKQTGQALDVAIQGTGFLEVSADDGTLAYSRGGSLTIDKDGFLATADGHVLKPAIHLGQDAKDISIKSDGQVLARIGTQTSAAEVGRIELAHFSDDTGLIALGSGLYKPSERSGDAIYGKPGDEGIGTLSQGFVEASNVQLVDSMVDLMAAQRAYESNVKVIQASDEMLAMSNNLRK